MPNVVVIVGNDDDDDQTPELIPGGWSCPKDGCNFTTNVKMLKDSHHCNN